MVLQQGIKVPVWGIASPQERIRISFLGKNVSVNADKRGKWIARLEAGKPGGPFVMQIAGKNEKIELKNVMVGEVWIASGQSNMEFRMLQTSRAAQDITNANLPNIRLFTVGVNTSVQPLDNINKSKWMVCSPATVPGFSAVAYYFASTLHAKLNVPLGIINASLGSSAAESWTSRNMLEELPEFRDKIVKLDTDTSVWNQKVERIKHYETKERKQIAESAAEGVKAGAHQLDYDETSWKVGTFPMNMQKIGLPYYWGFVWFRKTFSLSEDQLDQDLKLEIQLHADQMITYLNGEEIGSFLKAPMPSTVTIRKNLLRKGRNVVAIRIRTYFGTAYLGTQDSPLPQIVAPNNAFRIPMGGDWRYSSTLEPKIMPNQEYFNTPSVLYNGMIAPLVPYGIRGVIWYQGESNATRPNGYRTLFPSLITDWRKNWGQGDFPFLFVQLAGRKKEGEQDPLYALTREAQTYALKLPRTAMATAIDLGEKYDSHPKDKLEVGRRLALAALKVAYGQDLVYSGPVYQKMEVEDNSIRLYFSSVGSGLTSRGTKLRGFKIAGENRVFVDAEATISGNHIVVSSPQIKKTVGSSLWL